MWVKWIAAVTGWDGLLPLFVLLMPRLIDRAFPGDFWPQQLTVVLLPVGAVILRGVVGWRAIAKNNCNERLREKQKIAFCWAVIMLFLFDFTTVLMQLLPEGLLRWDTGKLIALAIGVPVYLTLMSVAMYPGRDTEETRPPQLIASNKQ